MAPRALRTSLPGFGSRSKIIQVLFGFQMQIFIPSLKSSSLNKFSTIPTKALVEKFE